jgi:prostaglandin-endoperoxide synthase 2
MPLWRKVIDALPPLRRFVNEAIIKRFAASTPPRPHRFTLWSPSSPTAPVFHHIDATRANVAPKPPPNWVSDYTSWPGLFDRTFTARHLPPRRETDKRPVPDPEAVADLFLRKGQMRNCVRSSALFCFFAQWFTDSFLRTHPTDARRTTSNHEIDLCQIYGLDESSTWALRAGTDGLLKARSVNGFEYPCLLYDGGKLDEQYFDPDPTSDRGLTYLRAGRAAAWEAALDTSFPGATSDPDRRDWFYASGLDRGGSTIVYSALNTIFLREHNRIARALAKVNKDWNDNRLFETARLVNIHQVLGIVVNDYITHIAGEFDFSLDRTFAERERWYRTNRISIEFDLLYRWHSLVPDQLTIDGKELSPRDYRFNNRLLEEFGIEAVISAASTQPAGRIGLFNTPDFLRMAELRGLQWARDFRIEGFNAYRRRFGLEPYSSIGEMVDDAAIGAKLEKLYGGDVEAVEFTVGLFAEKRDPSAMMAETVTTMVAYDAFTHILTNPVLASEIHCEATFSPLGWEMVSNQPTLAEIVQRNVNPDLETTVSLHVAGDM